MRWILHRGNYNGPNTIENNPIELLNLIEKDYELEIDLWYRDNRFYLGHDFPEYEIEEEFLEHNGLWIHCKHTNEDYVLTSKGYIWCFVGKPALENSVIVMPEKALSSYTYEELISKNCIVCSDYLEDYIKPLLKKD